MDRCKVLGVTLKSVVVVSICRGETRRCGPAVVEVSIQRLVTIFLTPNPTRIRKNSTGNSLARSHTV
jgi:predicted Na+-dependent transporter